MTSNDKVVHARQLCEEVNAFFDPICFKVEDFLTPTVDSVVKFIEVVLNELNVDVSKVKMFKSRPDDHDVLPVITIRAAFIKALPFIQLDIFDILKPRVEIFQRLVRQIMGFLSFSEDRLQALEDNAHQHLEQENRLKQLQHEKEALKQAINACAMEKDSMGQKKTEGESKQVDLRKEDKDLLEVENCLKVELDKVKKSEGEVKIKVEEAQRRIEGVQGEIDKCHLALANVDSVKHLSEKLQSLEARKEELLDGLKLKRENVDKWNNLCQKLSELVAKLNEVIHIFERIRETDAKKKEILSLKTQTEVLRCKSDGFLEKISQLQTRDRTETTRKGIKEEISSMQRDWKELEEANSRYQATLGRLTEDMENLKQEEKDYVKAAEQINVLFRAVFNEGIELLKNLPKYLKG